MSNEASSSSSMTAPLLSAPPSTSHDHKLTANTQTNQQDYSAELTPIPSHTLPDASEPPTPPHPRTYKRRYLALAQLALLNIIVSWSWLSFAPISSTAASYFSVSIASIDWLSTGFLFAFVAAAPACLYVLNRFGPGGAIRVASVLIAAGSWIRYAGARIEGGEGFKVVVVGQVVIGLAQPFVLSAPVRFSEMWFSERGRIGATAVASLANPLGGALGQLITPFWAPTPSSIPNMVLYISLISTLSTLPTLFLPTAPPTPPTTTTSTTPTHPPITRKTFHLLIHNPSFPLLALPFAIYVSAFNATSSLLVPILTPFAPFDEVSAGIAGALLIVVGLVSSAITSPILDRHPALRLPFVKLLVPVIATSYVLLIFLPSTGSVAGIYTLMSILGAASFSLVPLALEMLVDVTGPDVGAEVSSTVCWAAGQLGGAVFIVVMDALQRRDMKWGCVFQAVLCCVVVPAPLCLGYFGTGGELGRRGKGALGEGSGRGEVVEEEIGEEQEQEQDRLMSRNGNG